MATTKIIKASFPVLDMSCASCAIRVDKTLKKQEGVLDSSVNFASETATIQYDPEQITPQLLKQAVQSAGYDLLIESSDHLADDVESAQNEKIKKLKRHTFLALILSIPIVIIGMFFMDMPYANELMWILSTPVIFGFGREFFVNAWKLLKHRSANMDTLVALSTGIAYLFSVFNVLFPSFWLSRGVEPHVYFEAVSVVITFILLGRLLEEKAKGNTSSAIKKLMGLQPKTVTIINENNEQKELPISNIKIGDVIVVKPGEKIAVDGIVSQGSSYVDESMLSGEPVPVLKEEKSKVFAGTINQKGSFYFTAEKVGSDTMLAQIISMVQDAQGSKAPVQQLVDKIAGVFVPVIISISILSFILWMVFDHTNGFSHGLLAMVTVLIIACPCALGLATPTAIMVGISKGAENGILIKDAESLEVAKKVNAIVLDKTGTITEGKPVVVDSSWVHDDDHHQSILYSLEKLSEHPLAVAVTNYYETQNSIPISNFESITGKGAKGQVDGEWWYVGNDRLIAENNIEIDTTLRKKAEEWKSQSKTVIWFANSKTVQAIVAIEDKIKETTAQAIKQLNESGIETYMLTGDNEGIASNVANQVGIKNYKAEVLPNEKADFVKQLQSQGHVVAMVGDGINDSAALAQADLSIAMGRGSDIAMDVAKMTIISSDLMKIPQALKLSKLTVRTIRQNLIWAFIYNLIGVPIAAGILYPFDGFLLNPMIAGAAMALSSVSVVSNSLLLKTKKI